MEAPISEQLIAICLKWMKTMKQHRVWRANEEENKMRTLHDRERLPLAITQHVP